MARPARPWTNEEIRVASGKALAWLVWSRDCEIIYNRSTTTNLAEFITQPLSHKQCLNSLLVFKGATLRMKIDFIICGTQKGGTSALDAYLRRHPEICMAISKEVHFFDNEKAFCDGLPDYSLYHSFFSPQPSHKLVGEATPVYMYWRDATRRIWQYNPNIKLIVVLRNPIDRAYSNWNMERLRNRDTVAFWEAIQNEEERCREALPYQHRIYSYIEEDSI